MTDWVPSLGLAFMKPKILSSVWLLFSYVVFFILFFIYQTLIIQRNPHILSVYLKQVAMWSLLMEIYDTW
jgi:hypothetical protein